MMATKIKSLTLFFLLISTSLHALPERYQVIAQETVKNFYFFEDQPWLNTPPKIQFRDKISSQKIIVLHLWATSCPTCVAELKSLEQTAQDYMNAPIEFIILSLNDPRSGVLRNYFNRNRYVNLKPYHRASGSRPPIKGLPTTFFFNKRGKLIGRLEGAAKWEEDEMRRLLNRLVDEVYEPEVTPLGFFEKVFEKVREWIKKCFS